MLLVLSLGLSGCRLLQGPQPSSDALMARPGFVWRQDSTAHFTIYYEAGAPAAQRLDRIKQDAEASLTHLLALLELPSYDTPLHLFVVDSRDRMAALVGHATNGTAYYQTGVLAFLVSEQMTLSARHELLHVVAMDRWGVPDRWINEGLAVYADDQGHGHGLHALAHHLDTQGQLLPLADLTRRFRRHNDLVSYPQAGSVIKYLYEHHGLAAVRAIWTQGVGAVEDATGRSLSDLEAEWLAVVRATDARGITYATQ